MGDTQNGEHPPTPQLSSSWPRAQGHWGCPSQLGWGTLAVPRAQGTDLTSTPPGPEALHTPRSPRAPPLSSPASPRERSTELAEGRDTGQPSRLPWGQALLPGLGRHCPITPTDPQRHGRRDPAPQTQPPSTCWDPTSSGHSSRNSHEAERSSCLWGNQFDGTAQNAPVRLPRLRALTSRVRIASCFKESSKLLQSPTAWMAQLTSVMLCTRASLSCKS